MGSQDISLTITVNERLRDVAADNDLQNLNRRVDEDVGKSDSCF